LDSDDSTGHESELPYAPEDLLMRDIRVGPMSVRAKWMAEGYLLMQNKEGTALNKDLVNAKSGVEAMFFYVFPMRSSDKDRFACQVVTGLTFVKKGERACPDMYTLATNGSLPIKDVDARTVMQRGTWQLALKKEPFVQAKNGLSSVHVCASEVSAKFRRVNSRLKKNRLLKSTVPTETFLRGPGPFSFRGMNHISIIFKSNPEAGIFFRSHARPAPMSMSTAVTMSMTKGISNFKRSIPLPLGDIESASDEEKKSSSQSPTYSR
jgi:hypothetical protein